MAKGKKAKVVDGFSALKAAQRHVQAHPAPPADPPAQKKAKNTPVVASHIAHTAMPTKLDLVCYQCGYQFKMTGRAKHTLCPKCKKQLDLSDHVLTGPFSDVLVTAGTVRLEAGAVLDGGQISATDIVLQGTVISGRLHAHKTLELAPGASFPPASIEARHLRVATGMSILFKGAIEFENVDILGTLDATLTAHGLVTIRSGGHFHGTLRTGHLSVEEGGGLTATVDIGPTRVPTFERKGPFREAG